MQLESMGNLFNRDERKVLQELHEVKKQQMKEILEEQIAQKLKAKEEVKRLRLEQAEKELHKGDIDAKSVQSERIADKISAQVNTNEDQDVDATPVNKNKVTQSKAAFTPEENDEHLYLKAQLEVSIRLITHSNYTSKTTSY
eukprot:TRINITY_DN9384_c0_g1_i5.p2 TRINITY_DN9384_c0_g1~~TRINITY_DN9384_c0_g1_i5.p2  ORF type:complete len:142 (+),score=37.19 TRINITY_DN9384_c0_g1_i5:484-909(+)